MISVETASFVRDIACDLSENKSLPTTLIMQQLKGDYMLISSADHRMLVATSDDTFATLHYERGSISDWSLVKLVFKSFDNIMDAMEFYHSLH